MYAAPWPRRSAPARPPDRLPAPTPAQLLGSHREREVQKGIAQLKLAFDNCEKVCPGLSAEVLAQVFEVCAVSSNGAVRAIVTGNAGDEAGLGRDTRSIT